MHKAPRLKKNLADFPVPIQGETEERRKKKKPNNDHLFPPLFPPNKKK